MTPGRITALVIWMLLVGGVVLYPYNIRPLNGVHWLENTTGLFFDGSGFAYSDTTLVELARGPLEELTIELWIFERKTSQNFGPRALVSIYDGRSSPPMMLGEWGNRLLLFVPGEPWGSEFYQQFLTDTKLLRGREHFVALTLGGGRKAIYLDGALVEERAVTVRSIRALREAGPLVVAAAPDGRYRWEGEVLALAVYARKLGAEELEAHADYASGDAPVALEEVEGLIALYGFDEGAGDRVRNRVGSGDGLVMPKRFSALPTVLMDLPMLNRPWNERIVADALRNVALFLPLGWLLSPLVFRARTGARVRVAIAVIALGAALSVGIEFTQLYIPSRASTLLDIFNNTLGTAIGVLAAWGLRASGRQIA